MDDAGMGKRPTSHDVARLAGVSQSTVSFVLTGRAGI
jgi:DNA-binding LacI/PurR family transcriptional regulator